MHMCTSIKLSCTVHKDYTCQRTEHLCTMHIRANIPCKVHGRPLYTMNVKEKSSCTLHDISQSEASVCLAVCMQTSPKLLDGMT